MFGRCPLADFLSGLDVVYILEATVIGMCHGKTAIESTDTGGGSLKGILAVDFIMFVVLMPFVALKELARTIGAIIYMSYFRA